MGDEKIVSVPAQRVLSVDAYRGFVMFLMMAEIADFGAVARALPESTFWAFVHAQMEHSEWTGCTLLDMVQPSFSFLVGVAFPFSLMSRTLRGQSNFTMWQHTLKRALIMVLLGIFLRSMDAEQTNFTFEDTLTQIGLGYPFLFLVRSLEVRTRGFVIAGILFFYWLFFALYPLPGPGFNWADSGVASNWEHHFSGFAAHWNKNTNAAWAFDTWFMNLFARPDFFKNNSGGYSTLNFIPTLATMILGTIAGSWLQARSKFSTLISNLIWTGLTLVLWGLVLSWTGVNPIVKRIWTPAWTLFSGGLCFLLLAGFYYLVDHSRLQRTFFPFVVIGSNSIAAYVMAHTLIYFIDQSLRIHVGPHYSLYFGEAYKTLFKGLLILLGEWFVLYKMYQNRFFVKI